MNGMIGIITKTILLVIAILLAVMGVKAQTAITPASGSYVTAVQSPYHLTALSPTSGFSQGLLMPGSQLPATVLPGKPDLQIVDLSFPHNPRAKEFTELRVNVKNNGPGAIDLNDYNEVIYGPCTGSGALKSCPVIGDTVIRLIAEVQLKEGSSYRTVYTAGYIMKKELASKEIILPGETVTFTFDRGLYFPQVGDYKVKLTADANDKVDESNENNNRYEELLATRFATVIIPAGNATITAVLVNRTNTTPPTGGGSGNGFTVSEALVGGENQERQNDVTATFTIKNNLNTAVSGIQVTSSADSRYNVRFTNVPASISAGQQATVTVTANIPEDFDAVGTDCLEQAFEIGTVTVKGNSLVQGTSKLKMQAKNHVEIRDFDVEVGGRSENVNDRDDVEVKPRELIRLIAELKNTFNDNTHDFSIEGDLEVDAEEDGDEGLDLTDDREDFDIDADDTEDIEFSGEVGREIEDGKMSVKVKACGEDENGARHGDVIEFNLDVDKEKKSLEIEDAAVSPSVVSCDGTATVSFTIFNDGKRDLDEVSYAVENAELGISIEQDELELDEGDDRKISKTFRVDKSKAKKDGEYELSIKVYSEGSLMDEKELKFSAKDCEEVKEKKEVVPPKVSPSEQPKTEEPAQKIVKKSFRNSPWYVVFLITAILLLGGTAGYFGWLIYKQEW